MSETDPIDAAARELEARRAGTDVAVPEPAATPAPEQNGEDPNDQGMSLKVAAKRRAERTAREAQERAAYEAAALLSERELPANLDASDAELTQQELAALRATMESIQAGQRDSYARLKSEEAAHQQVEAANQNYEASRQVATAYNAAMEGYIQQERQALLAEFPEAASDAGVIELARTDPYRAQEYAQRFQEGEGRIALARREHEQALQNYAANFQQLAEMHDAEFQRSNPDMVDPELRDAAAKGVVAMLKESGYSDQEIRQGWQLGVGPLSACRDHRHQTALLELWRNRVAKRHLHDARQASRPAPPRVQRPGALSSGDVNELRSLTRSLEEKGSVKAAAALLSARRAYQRGSR